MQCDEDQQENEDDTLFQNYDGSIVKLEPYNLQCSDASIQITQRIIESDDETNSNTSIDQQIEQAIPSLVNSILEMMLKQQCTILIIVIIHAILNTIFTCLNIYFRKDPINKLQSLFDDEYRAEQLYWTLCIIDILSCLIYYHLAIQAYRFKSYKLYQQLLNWVYYCFFIQVFLAYTNKLNILLVVLKVLTYIYSKFVAQLIKDIVKLPRQHQD